MQSDRRSSGTLLQQRHQLPWPQDKKFKILSIDGGGIKGILPAQILAEIEVELCNGKPISSYFDMITGTSTGGILAIGLAAGVKARDLLSMYLDRGSEIFPKKGKVLLSPFSTIHDRGPLESIVRETLGKRKFGEANTRLCIPSLYNEGEPVMRKTAHHPDYKKDHAREMASVALETSAAPLFLGGYRESEEIFLDGGLFINNPIMAAVVDALACYQVQRHKISVLSIGCGHTPLTFDEKIANKGATYWAANAQRFASHLQSHNALGQAGLLIGRNNVLRVDPTIKVEIDMDDYKEAASRLPSLGKKAFTDNKSDMLHFFETQVLQYERHHS
ncbi:MAG: patatin [Robiginitomaculum sp.]|nr:MAG: patatin [Robiginitomaculum sp.]